MANAVAHRSYLDESRGSGIPRMIRRCAEYGLPELQFEEFGDRIKVTMFRKVGNATEKVGSATEKVGNASEKVGNATEKIGSVSEDDAQQAEEKTDKSADICGKSTDKQGSMTLIKQMQQMCRKETRYDSGK